jgi:hypothetical protein
MPAPHELSRLQEEYELKYELHVFRHKNPGGGGGGGLGGG